MKEINLTSNGFSIDLRDRGPVRGLADWIGWRRTLGGVYVAPAWPSSVLTVRLDLPELPLRWAEAAAAKRDQLLTQLQHAKTALADASKCVNVGGWPTERHPLPHQKQAATAAAFMGWNCMFADHMGLGKTSSALWAVEDSMVKRVLVLCPVSVKFNWQAEIEATLGKKRVAVIDGTKTQRANALSTIERVQFVIINYDLLRHLDTQTQWAPLIRWLNSEDSALLCDESHYLKARDSQRSTLARELRAAAKFCMPLSGTPVRDTVEDWFNQIEMCRPSTFRSFAHFESRYLVKQTVEFGKRKVRKTVGSKNVEELNAIVNTMVIRRKKEDVLDLPPKMHSYPQLELDHVSRVVYSEMRDHAKMEIAALLEERDEDGEPLTIFHPRARSAVEGMMRLEQIAQGFLGGVPEPVMQRITASLKFAEKIPGRPGELMFPSATKVQWAIEAIETVLAQEGAPLMFSRFNAPMVWLEAHLSEKGLRARFMHGGLSADEKHQTVTDFKERRIDVLLCQVKIAEGWNATRSQDVLFYGRDWSPAINFQAEDRAHRMGQSGTVNVQIPIVLKSIELLQHKRLASKHTDAEQSLNNLTLAELMENL